MSNPFSYFDAIYCINLDSRGDRWRSVSARFDKMGIDNVQRFPGIFHEDGAVGAMLSHREIIADAQSKWYKTILVLEDDAVFFRSIEYYQDICRELSVMPWKIMSFGGSFKRGISSWKKISPQLRQVRGMFGAIAIAYHEDVYEELLSTWPQDFQYAQDFISQNISFDSWIARDWSQENPMFCTSRLSIYEKPGYSSIDQGYRWNIIRACCSYIYMHLISLFFWNEK